MSDQNFEEWSKELDSSSIPGMEALAKLRDDFNKRWAKAAQMRIVFPEENVWQIDIRPAADVANREFIINNAKAWVDGWIYGNGEL